MTQRSERLYLVGGVDLCVETFGSHGDPKVPGIDSVVLAHHARRARLERQRLAREIPGAQLLTLDRAGHELHPLDWDTLVEPLAGAAGA